MSDPVIDIRRQFQEALNNGDRDSADRMTRVLVSYLRMRRENVRLRDAITISATALLESLEDKSAAQESKQ